MPWTTPTLRKVRETVRDDVSAALDGAVLIGNNVLRVMSDAMAGLCHLVLRYIDWLSLQLLPDTAEREWLDRHGDIWLVNSDSTTGRKMATAASGVVNFIGDTAGIVIPQWTALTYVNDIRYETTEAIVTASDQQPTPAATRAITPGLASNLLPGTSIDLDTIITGVSSSAIVESMGGGTDAELDEDLRARVLRRIRQPPMGGDAYDYENWALAVPGVTRAWCAANEMGMGTVTVRFMCDEMRADNEGFPFQDDIDAVTDYLNQMRPVAVKDFWVVSPIREPIDFTIRDLVPETTETRAAITESVKAMIYQKAAPAHTIDGVNQPGQTIYAAWVSDAIMQTPQVDSFTLVMSDHPMPNNGALAVLGTIVYD